MKMRYKKALGIVYVAVGIIFVCLNLMIILNGGRGIALFGIGIIGIIYGELFFTRTYFIVNDDSLVLNALLGTAETTYKLQSIKDLEIGNGKIYINQDGKRQKLSISTWMIDKNDWQALLQKVKSAT